MPRPSARRSVLLSPAEARHYGLLRRLPAQARQLLYDITTEIAWQHGVSDLDPDPSPGASEPRAAVSPGGWPDTP